MQLPTPLTIPWDPNLRQSHNAYFRSLMPLLKYVGFAVEINQGCPKPRIRRPGCVLGCLGHVTVAQMTWAGQRVCASAVFWVRFCSNSRSYKFYFFFAGGDGGGAAGRIAWFCLNLWQATNTLVSLLETWVKRGADWAGVIIGCCKANCQEWSWVPRCTCVCKVFVVFFLCLLLIWLFF